MTAADLHTADINHGVLGMEFPVCLFEGVGYLTHCFNDFHRLQQSSVHPADIANHTQNGGILSRVGMYFQAGILQPPDEGCLLSIGCTGF